MISFTVITKKNFTRTLCELFESEEERLAVFGFFSELELELDAEYAVCRSRGCLIARICLDSEYVFAFPEPLSDNADIRAAVTDIEKYVIKEEIAFSLCDVPKEYLHYLDSYPHMTLEDGDGESCFVKILNECQLLSEIPSESCGRVTLNALNQDDIESYARLCRNEDLLKYWGYDYRGDYGEVSDEFFYQSQKRDFEMGTSVTFAVRGETGLVGSLELYAFDYHRGAEIDVRIAPSEQGRGYASRALELAVIIARKMGLSSLKARVMNENTASLRLFEKYAKRLQRDEKTSLYILDI